LLGVPKLATFFNDKDYLPGDNVDSNGTTVKSSGCCSRLIWDHGKHTHHFKHRDSNLPEIVLYPGHGYLSAFCLCLRRRYDDNIAFAFSSSFSISPSHDETAALVSDNEDSDNKNFPDSLCGTQYNSQDDTQDSEGDYWYSPPSPPSTPPPIPPPPPPPNLPSLTAPSNSFELSMSLSFYNSTGRAETVVYKGVRPDGLTHTVRRQDGTRLNVHDAHLWLKVQADLSNILQMPLDYCKEVGQGITKEEAEILARPSILTLMQ
jgi:hypothetical protein